MTDMTAQVAPMSGLLTRERIIKWAPLLVLAALLLLFPFFEWLEDFREGKEHLYLIDSRFFSIRNAARIGITASPSLMVAVGVTFIIIMGSIDLSMEGTVSVCAVLFAFAFLTWGGTLASWAWLAIPFVLLVGAAMGFINGLVHVRLKIPSFMASLAMGFVGTGFALLLTGGDRIRIEDELFRSLLTLRWFNFPVMCYVALGFLLLAWFIQSRTTLGRNFYAVGGEEELAHASGLNVNRVRVLVLPWRACSSPSARCWPSAGSGSRKPRPATTSCSYPSPRWWSAVRHSGVASAESGTP